MHGPLNVKYIHTNTHIYIYLYSSDLKVVGMTQGRAVSRNIIKQILQFQRLQTDRLRPYAQ